MHAREMGPRQALKRPPTGCPGRAGERGRTGRCSKMQWPEFPELVRDRFQVSDAQILKQDKADTHLNTFS